MQNPPPQTAQTQKFIARIGGREYSLPNVALLLMLAGIMAPPVLYTIQCRIQTPQQLIICVCISLFSSVLFLWIMDAVSILPFRSDWISKSVYGAAIVSILGTSVGVYSEFFTDRKYQYEGEWEISFYDKKSKLVPIKTSVILLFSRNTNGYWGYSNYEPDNLIDTSASVWFNISDFNPTDKKIALTAKNIKGGFSDYSINLIESRIGCLFESDKKDSISFTMNRRR